MSRLRIAAAIALLLTVSGAIATADVIQLMSPDEIPVPVTIINFDDLADRTAANVAYLPLGIEFMRDDGSVIPIADWAATNRETTSKPNVIATILGTFDGQVVPGWATHLNLVFSSPVNAVGAFFGNDGTFFGNITETLSVFGDNDALLGSVTVDSNNNTHVDQFIGVFSDVPFSKARFENDSAFYSVVLDDVMFATVPEPSGRSLCWIGAVYTLFCLRIRRQGLQL